MRMEKSRLWICVIAAMITLSACGVSGERTSQVSSDTRQTSSEEASAVFWDNSAAASEVPTTSVAQTVLPTETVPPTLPTYPLVRRRSPRLRPRGKWWCIGPIPEIKSILNPIATPLKKGCSAVHWRKLRRLAARDGAAFAPRDGRMNDF